MAKAASEKKNIDFSTKKVKHAATEELVQPAHKKLTVTKSVSNFEELDSEK